INDGTFEDKKEDLINDLKAAEEDFYTEYNEASDVKITAAMLQYFYEDIPNDQHPQLLNDIVKKYGTGVSGATANAATFTKYAAELYKTSMMKNKEKFKAFLNNPTKEAIESEPAYQLYMGFYENYVAKIAEKSKAFGERNAELG